ncbi:major facilitator superfamily domain-containing protein 12-like [Colias croceus]|uniref:major facilitator superfamily domain-containing protein 12-like n=1 Tax=Colias crocea TaxID=72248 RepID=UPI001E27FCB0|nr:major facilitator superfamily domain-containing protein 12-like [Colias croceus]
MDNEFFDISTSLRLQLGYGIGHILNDVCASLWFTYFLVFFHLVLEFTASQAGYLMLIGQVVDAVSTPFIGYHSDHTNNSVSAWYGRRKLWHLFGSACVLMSFPFIFSQCIGCSLTHKWAQMYYYASFILIFQIGWAAVQISHLSLIPELAEDPHVRTHLTAIRYGFTVFSNLFVYLITWAILHFTGQCDKEQVGPGDAWKFKQIMLIVLSIGTLATILFHFSITEKQARYAIADNTQNATFHCSIFKKWLLYQVAGVYMCTRLVVNVSQVLIPLYLHRTLGLAARSLAVVPLAMYLGSLAAAGVQRLAPRSITRKLCYFIGSAFSLCGFVWIYFDTDYNFKVYFIYIVAVLIGFGGAQMLVTSLSLTADLVGENTQGSAFVYGLMSFTDKLSCGIAIALIQLYADQSGAMYYRYALSIVCGAACLLGLCFTVCLPKLTHNTLIVTNDGSINASDQEVVPSGPEI